MKSRNKAMASRNRCRSYVRLPSPNRSRALNPVATSRIEKYAINTSRKDQDTSILRNLLFTLEQTQFRHTNLIRKARSRSNLARTARFNRNQSLTKSSLTYRATIYQSLEERIINRRLNLFDVSFLI